MIAPEHREEPVSIRKLAFLDVLDPCSKRPKRNFVLGFASYGAGMATDAFAMVNNKAVFHLVLVAQT